MYKIERGTIFQIFAALVANLMAISDGMTVGWTSPMIPYFVSGNGHITMTQHEAEWLETWVLLGAIIGLPFTVYLVNKIGRKKSLLLASFLLLVAWTILIFVKRLEFIYLSRVIAGMGGDMAFVAAPCYIAEIADQKIRGFLSSIIYLMMLTGVLTIYITGPYAPYNTPPIIGICLLIIELAIFSMLPETPYYLLLSGNRKAAEKSLKFYRSYDSVEKELADIMLAVERQKSDNGGIKDIIKVKSYRKAFLIMTVLNAAQQFSSVNVILMNMHQILAAAGSVYLEPSLTAIIFASIMFLAAALASSTVDKFGRKMLLCLSSILTGLSLLSLAVYFHLKELKHDSMDFNWLPLVSVMVYALVYKYGLGMVPIVITAEIFASKIKALGMALVDTVYVGSALISINLYNIMKDTYGIYVPFYFFASCSFMTSLYVIFFIPETKGKTLDEIQLMLEKN
ncbi:facilitated trehalose transporter Tret1-like isoform X1 [Diorhabda carinulata]|uniref:facilitated trehalose transporter Tret1-like isoform X1 n=2 Tax=Diorhabda carinulata TaxID=1163345 RepID=UPI0025A1EDFB|nr:facilitated trehalose transporter Tret1-like isoform X1 [Diorhabda carinulata]